MRLYSNAQVTGKRTNGTQEKGKRRDCCPWHAFTFSVRFLGYRNICTQITLCQYCHLKELSKIPKCQNTRIPDKYSLSLHVTETAISSGLMGHLARMQTLPTLPFHLATVGLCAIYFVYIRYVNRPKYNITPTHLEVSEDALMLKNVAFDSLATALAWKKEKKF